VVGCNYLFPAGSSSVHSHFHIFLDSIPLGYVKKLLDESKCYFDKSLANYWSELVEAEKKEKERYIGSIGNTEWLVPFAPTGDYEVYALVREKSSFLDLTREDITALAEGLAKVLQYYNSQKLFSFNMLLYSGPLGDKLGSFWSGLKVASRAYLPPYYTSDVTWRQRLMQRYELWIETPEKVATALRAAF
jgi:galactose-1-phosphate uridylyltransferase